MESLGLRAMRGYFVVMSPGENENEKMVVPGSGVWVCRVRRVWTKMT
jgi:hypothetical protein